MDARLRDHISQLRKGGTFVSALDSWDIRAPNDRMDAWTLWQVGDGEVRVTIEYGNGEGFDVFRPDPSNDLEKGLAWFDPTHRAKPPTCHARVDSDSQNLCTREQGHEGPHRCSAADVDA